MIHACYLHFQQRAQPLDGVTMVLFMVCVQIYRPLNISLLGAFIHACIRSGRHLIMYNEESSLFNATLSPLHDTISTPRSGGAMA